MTATRQGSGAIATRLFHDRCIHRSTDVTIRYLLTLLINRGRSCPTQRATRWTQHKDSAQIAMENVGCDHGIYCVHFWILVDPGRRRTGTNDPQEWLCLHPSQRTYVIGSPGRPSSFLCVGLVHINRYHCLLNFRFLRCFLERAARKQLRQMMRIGA